MGQPPRHPSGLFARWAAETRRIAAILRKETIGGALLLAGALLALGWANSPWSASYHSLLSYRIGPPWLHLDLTLAQWAADGLLAIFFFVAGVELKREFVAGDLRDRRRAAVPVAAAVGGVVVPAALYTLVNVGGGGRGGWAIPTATDIAFALAVLAVIGRHLPSALRTFLLTLAVVDDLLAIVIIAVVYTSHLAVGPLLGALVPLAVFTGLVQHRVRSRWLLPAGCWCTPPGCTPPSPGAAGLCRAGGRQPAGWWAAGWSGAGRVLRAPLATDLGGAGGADLCSLLRWGECGWADRAGQRAD